MSFRLPFIIGICLFTLFFFNHCCIGATYGGGSGTQADPYQIATKAHLVGLGSTPADYDKHFIMTADIDLSGTIYTTALIAPDTDNSSSSFDGPSFAGVFDGRGHKITGLVVDGADAGNDFLGLFGRIASSEFKNLAVEGCSVTGDRFVGGLVGRNDGSVSNCYSTGSVSGVSYIGGLVGQNWGSVSNSYSTGFLSGGNYVGGLAGYNLGSVSNSYSTYHVGATGYKSGGLVGVTTTGGSISNSYSTGSASGQSSVGGLVGSNLGNVSNCYSTGPVSGGSSVGGLVGYNSGSASVLNSFWDTDTSGWDFIGAGTGKTTLQMKTLSTFTDAGWDFVGESANGTEGIWRLPMGDYPVINACIGAPYGGGSGTQADPYQIGTKAHLEDLGKSPCDYDKHFIMTADIDLSGATYVSALIAPDTDNSTDWFQGSSFSGVFDGSGHKITGLVIDDGGAGNDYLALFGSISFGEVKNLGVEDCSLSGHLYVAGLVGFNAADASISNSYSTGSLSGGTWVGGLMADNNGSVSNSYSTCDVNATGQYAGGLLGTNWGSVSNSYSTGSLSGVHYVGGLVGVNNGSVSNSYSAGSVSGSTDVGGLVGVGFGSAPNSFWDKDTSGQTTSAGGTGKTTAEMKTLSTFTDAGWDFVWESANGTEDIWELPAGDYPIIATGATIYVDGVRGSDDVSGNGSELNPYKTVQKALHVAGNGDRIIILAGTYLENITMNKQVTIRAQGGLVRIGE